MSTKGSKLSKESREKISKSAKSRNAARRAQLELIMRGNRLFVRAVGNNAVSVEMDVTPLWHFFKGAMKYSEEKSAGRIPNPNDPDYEDLQASE